MRAAEDERRGAGAAPRRRGALDLACVGPLDGATALRARDWQRGLERIGLAVPLFVVHDLGRLLLGLGEVLASPSTPERPAQGALQRDAAGYRRLLVEVADTLATHAPTRRPPPEGATVALLAELLRDVPEACRALAAGRPLGDATALAAMEALRESLLARVDALPLGLASEARDAPPDGEGDLRWLLALRSTEASAAVALAAAQRRAPAAGRGHGARGPSPDALDGLGHGADPTRMLLSELAWDDETLAARHLAGELLGHDVGAVAAGTTEHRLVLVDRSPSMRGERGLLAQAFALQLLHRAVADGALAELAVFDARLQLLPRRRGGWAAALAAVAPSAAPGRDAEQAFRELERHLAGRPDLDRQSSSVVVLSHASLAVPEALVARLRGRTQLGAILIAPDADDADDQARPPPTRERLGFDWLTIAGRRTALDAPTGGRP